MGELSGRVAMITGAGGGLGTAVTKAFLEAGVTIAAVSRSAPGVPTSGAGFLSLEADLAMPAEAARAVAAIVAKFQRLDIVLHLAGGFEGGVPVADTADETWRRMMDTNLNAAFFVARESIRAMRGLGRGRFVAVGSRTGVEPAANLAAYGVSKAGLVALVRTMALEVKGSGITANVILPSVIDTAANRAAMPRADFSKWVKPESIARLLLWLASDAAADVNGAAIPIYGGV